MGKGMKSKLCFDEIFGRLHQIKSFAGIMMKYNPQYRKSDFIEKTSFDIQKRSFPGAGSEIRTYNPLITNEMPYR